MYRSGSANIAYDLPPPAEPPYRTSLSPAAKKSVCGPSLGEKIMFCGASSCNCVARVTTGLDESSIGKVSCTFAVDFVLFRNRFGFGVPFGPVVCASSFSLVLPVTVLSLL